MNMAEFSEADANPGLIVFNGEPRELYYFAYGSDMNREQIRSRCADPKAVAVARLPNSRIAFYGYSTVWDGALETVISASDDDVWGVMYDLSSSDRERLDGWHDARMDGSGASFHCPAKVTDQEGKEHTVLLYKRDVRGVGQTPSREYLDFIVQGAMDNELPPSYIERLRAMESRKAEFKVPRQSKSAREPLVEINCSQCGDDGLTIPDFLTNS
jgi:hypothetical protein